MSEQTPLYVFAKAPIAGQVKTRLQTHCSQQQAADIAEILLTETLEQCTRHWPGRVVLSVGNAPQHKSVQALATQFDVEIVSQPEGDLGERMRAVFELADAPAAIIGADASLVSATVLRAAYVQMQQNNNVIGPSEDGGYYLIGLNPSAQAMNLFDGIDWGTASVFQQTKDQAQRHSIALTLLSTLRDIDEWPDVLFASQSMPRLADYLRSRALV